MAARGSIAKARCVGGDRAVCARFALPHSRLGLTGAMQGRRLVFPEMLEPIGRQSGAPDGGHDRAVPEIGLDGANVVASELVGGGEDRRHASNPMNTMVPNQSGQKFLNRVGDSSV